MDFNNIKILKINLKIILINKIFFYLKIKLKIKRFFNFSLKVKTSNFII